MSNDYLTDAMIDTDDFISKTLGEPCSLRDAVRAIELSGAGVNRSEIIECLSNAYDIGEIVDSLELDVKWDNTCNNENDLSKGFIWGLVTETEEWEECYYADYGLVMAQTHRGGDIRGNYSRVEFYLIENAPNYEYFFDWQLSFSVVDLKGNNMDEEGEYSVGYHQSPINRLESDLVSRDYQPLGRWKEPFSGAFTYYLGRLNGKTVHCTPHTYVDANIIIS